VRRPAAARWAFRAAAAAYLVSFVLPLDPDILWTAQWPWFGGAWAFASFTPVVLFDPTAVTSDRLVAAGWLANPAFWVGLGAWVFRRPAVTFAAGVVAVLLAASVQAVYIDTPLLYPCYFAWLGSFVLLTLAGWFARPRAEEGP
jgi:hypothetical protein